MYCFDKDFGYSISRNKEKPIGYCICGYEFYPEDDVYEYENGETICEECYIDYNERFRRKARDIFEMPL